MKIVFLSVLLLSTQAWSNPFLDFTPDEDTVSEQEIPEVNQDDQTVEGKAEEAKKIDTIKLDVTAGKAEATMSLRMSHNFVNSGRSLSNIFTNLTEVSYFNSMAETVRSAEGGSAFQNTVKKDDPSKAGAYTLTTSAWGYKDTLLGKIKINAGSSSTYCVKSQVNGVYTLTCVNGSDSATKNMMKSSRSTLTCSQVDASTINCAYSIDMTPKEFSLFTKYMSANEVAFRSAMRAIRTNAGLFNFVVSGKGIGESYSNYNSSDLEKKVTEFGATFGANKAYSFNY